MAQPIRIAQVLNCIDNGGIENVLFNYYKAIDKSLFQFDIYYSEKSTFSQKSEIERLGGRTYPVPDYARPFALIKELILNFKRNNYKIVHVHMNTMSFIALFAAFCAGVPVRICHNHTMTDWSEFSRSLLKYLTRPINKLFANRYYACGINAGIWMYGKKNYCNNNVTIIPNAIDQRAFRYDSDNRIKIRKELSIKSDDFIIGHIGRFCPQKNHYFLLDILKHVLIMEPKSILLLIGDGPLLDDIKRKVQDLNLSPHVVFTGKRNDVNKIYSAMDIFCLPSIYEGMPLVAWEAQSNGLDCIFSDSISVEASISERAVFLSLSDPEIWAKELIKRKRITPRVVLDNPNIDINVQCSILEKLYMREVTDGN